MSTVQVNETDGHAAQVILTDLCAIQDFDKEVKAVVTKGKLSPTVVQSVVDLALANISVRVPVACPSSAADCRMPRPRSAPRLCCSPTATALSRTRTSSRPSSARTRRRLPPTSSSRSTSSTRSPARRARARRRRSRKRAPPSPTPNPRRARRPRAPRPRSSPKSRAC